MVASNDHAIWNCLPDLNRCAVSLCGRPVGRRAENIVTESCEAIAHATRSPCTEASTPADLANAASSVDRPSAVIPRSSSYHRSGIEEKTVTVERPRPYGRTIDRVTPAL
jgi:hypothetical protein